MFDILKKKISGFIDGLTKKEEQKPDELAQEAAAPQLKTTEHEPQSSMPIAESTEQAPEKKPSSETKAPEPEQTAGAAIKKAESVKPAKSREPRAIKAEPAPAPPKESPQKPQETKKIAQAGKAAMPGLPVKKETPAPIKEPEARREERKIPHKPAQEAAQPQPSKAAPPQKKEPPAVRTDAKKAGMEECPAAPEPAPPLPTIAPPAPMPESSGARGPQAKRPAAESAVGERQRMKLGVIGALKSIITREVEISEKDVLGMVDSLELELLEADVDLSVAEGIKNEIMERLVGSKVEKGRLHAHVSGAIRETLIDVLSNDKAFDLLQRADDSPDKPLKIVFLGINGAGKTTTIAKVAHLFQKSGKKIVFAAADTFRAAAIEQMAVHAERLNVKMIKRDYGSDPTSVAYDAVNYGRAHGMDAVLIDTAGRQDTNISLINEMKKMDRVIKPDIKIYIGESIAGNAILEQISSFNREIGIDAVILTKLDCDPKGGTMLSISRVTGVPIIYVGVGQSYDDLEPFDPARIAGRIVE